MTKLNPNKLLSVTFALLGLSSVALADFDAQHWRFERDIEIEPNIEFSEIVPDDALYRDSLAQLRDLRIIRSGVEVPYSIRTFAGKREEITLPVAIVNKAVVPHRGLTAVLDLRSQTPHNGIKIATAEKNFKETVLVETSDDAKQWAVANENGLIFDVSRTDRQISDLTVGYPLSTRRYLRLTIAGWHDPAQLVDALVLRFTETPALREKFALVTPIVTQDPKERSTSFLVDARFPGLPYDRLSVVPNNRFFSRVAEVLCSDDGKTWTLAGSGVLSKTSNQENLSITFPEMWMRYAKLVVFNGDDLPLEIPRIELNGLRRSILFPSKDRGSYVLYSGNASAGKPSYDLDQILPDSVQTVPARLDAAKPNPNFHLPSRPWTDRNPMLLNIILVVAVAVMAVITVRYFLKVKAV